ncbi:MAG: hypothetical protein QOJ59_3170 [Thermomicrobiales bacterium]|jgi:CheY-like chemotaxis protein|nr:hypothetical protein [Thermomicrobiales bacterium]
MSNVADVPLILVIDDDEAVLQIYQELLVDEGYRLCVHTFPPASTGALHRARPDVVLLDLLFAGEDAGWHFLRKLKGDPVTADIPVVVATANQRYAQQCRSQFDAWQCGIVLKPFDIDELAAAIQLALRRSERAGATAMPPGTR